MKNDTNKFIPNILIVDDVPANLKILGEILKSAGYKVRPVPNGILALQVIEKEKPDLILLDIMMPEMDGYEVFRRLKENPDFCDIPVIFISALSDISNVVKAFKSGAIDYVTKPFQAEEVLARVATHLKIYYQKHELKKLNAEKDKFFSIIAHDLRGPLGGFMSYTEMMMEESLDFSVEERRSMISDMNKSARNIFNLLENLLEWAKMQSGQIVFEAKKLNLSEIISDCLQVINEISRNKLITIETDIPDDIEVYADENMLLTIIRNLTSNAVKFTPKGGKVLISAYLNENNKVEISIKDSGIGMSSEISENLFRIDVNCNRPGTEGESSTGLGLILCKDFVEKHGGEIWVESTEGIGSTFYFTLS